MSALLYNNPSIGDRVRYVSSADAQSAGYPELYPGFYTSKPTPPKNVVAPVIAGDGGATAVGTLFEVTPGTYDAYPAPTLDYQWQVNGVPVPGETGFTYDSTDDAPDDFIACVETATNATGDVSKMSNLVKLT